MKKINILLLICLFMFFGIREMFAQNYDIQAVRIFGRTKKETAALLINNSIVLRIYSSSESGRSAFGRVEDIANRIDYFLKNGGSIASLEPTALKGRVGGFAGSFEMFSVEPGDTLDTYMPPLLLAYNWVNKIRYSFDAPLVRQNVVDEIIKAEQLKGHKIEVRKNIWGDKAELVVDGRVIMRLSENYPDITAYDRAKEIALEIEENIAEGKTGEDIRPSILKGNIFSVKLGSAILSLVEKEDAFIHNKDTWSVALERTNKLRDSFGVLPFSVDTVKSKLTQFGKASWYGGFFHGRRAASGERYDMNEFTAAHKTLPFGTEVLVTRLDNSQSVLVRITDRGPYVAGRIIDLSRSAAEAIGLLGAGVAKVRIDILEKPKR